MDSHGSGLDDALSALIGSTIILAAHAGDMSEFIFRPPATQMDTSPKQWSLYIQCPWRLDSMGEIVTGYFDWFERAEANEQIEDGWDPASGGSLQELRLREKFNDPLPSGGAIRNQSGDFRVTGVSSTAFGDLEITLTGQFKLRLFPSGSRGEFWRVFAKGDLTSHLVIEAPPAQQR